MENSSGLGCLLLILGGFIPALLYANATSRRVQCSHCGLIFRQPPLPKTSLSVFATWIISSILIFALLTFLLSYPEISSLIPRLPYLSALEQFVSENPRAIAIGLIPLLGIILVVCAVASWASNHQAHKKLQLEFKIWPESFSEAKNRQPADPDYRAPRSV